MNAAPFLASLLASPFVSLWGCLPTVASKVRKVLESSSAGATRRATLVRESVINAARGFINAPGFSTLAGILSWMFRRLVWPLLLLVLRPLLPVILRKYFLWKNWAESRFGDFVDAVCVDRKRFTRLRSELVSLELVYGVQLANLARLNVKGAQAAQNAETVYCDATRHCMWHAGKYEHLRPAMFLGPVAAVVPVRDPLPRLGLWYRLFHRIDMGIFWTSETIRRTQFAMAKNLASIADLECQLTARPVEVAAIKAQLEICRAEFLEKWRSEASQREEIKRLRTEKLAAEQAQRERRMRRVTSTTTTHTTTTTTTIAPTVATTAEAPPSEVALVVASVAAVVSPDPVPSIDTTTPTPTLPAAALHPSPRGEELPTFGHSLVLADDVVPRRPTDDRRAREKAKVAEIFEYLAASHA